MGTVELVGILGYYTLISMTLNVFRMLALKGKARVSGVARTIVLVPAPSAGTSILSQRFAEINRLSRCGGF